MERLIRYLNFSRFFTIHFRIKIFMPEETKKAVLFWNTAFGSAAKLLLWYHGCLRRCFLHGLQLLDELLNATCRQSTIIQQTL